LIKPSDDQAIRKMHVWKILDDDQGPGQDDPRQQRQPQIARPRDPYPPFLPKEEIERRIENHRQQQSRSNKLRAMNLTQHPWLSCRPPNIEAAVTERWPKPEGCD